MTANHTPAESRTRGNLVRVTAIVASMAVVGLMVVTASSAAFTASTENPDNAFDAATIALTDDDGGTAMFTVTDMVPGDVATGCITVTYTGTADPLEVKLYQNAYSETDGAADGATLDAALTFDIDQVNDCTLQTKLADLDVGTLLANAAHADYASGVATGWDPASGTSNESFLFTATFTPSGSSATDNTRIGDTVSNLIFTWETQAGS